MSVYPAMAGNKLLKLGRDVAYSPVSLSDINFVVKNDTEKDMNIFSLV